ncbi:MAG: DUF4280 domain-containing protein [Caldilinea sp.]
MPQQVTHGATLRCSFGAAPATLVVTPESQVDVGGAPAATIMDHAPFKNITPFGMCSSLANPQVAAATSAAFGTLRPQPCVPATNQPWAPGSPVVTVRGKPALNDMCTLLCQWAGVITVINAGQTKLTTP